MPEVSLKAINVVWWRFFWRYAVVFILLNLVAGIVVNYFGHLFPKGLYATTIFYGLFANLVASLGVMLYCIDRKFKGSSLVLQTKNIKKGITYKLWTWLLYFWRFILMAFAIGFLFGALFPLLLKLIGVDPVVALKYSKYLGNIAVLPASYLTFISLTWRKESKQTLRVCVNE